MSSGRTTAGTTSMAAVLGERSVVDVARNGLLQRAYWYVARVAAPTNRFQFLRWSPWEATFFRHPDKSKVSPRVTKGESWRTGSGERRRHPPREDSDIEIFRRERRSLCAVVVPAPHPRLVAPVVSCSQEKKKRRVEMSALALTCVALCSPLHRSLARHPLKHLYAQQARRPGGGNVSGPHDFGRAVSVCDMGGFRDVGATS